MHNYSWIKFPFCLKPHAYKMRFNLMTISLYKTMNIIFLKICSKEVTNLKYQNIHIVQ